MTLLLSRRDDAAVIAAGGPLLGRHEFDILCEALEFIPVDDGVIVDLSDVEVVDVQIAAELMQMLRRASLLREAVVVAHSDDVRLRLVLAGVDTVVPLVCCHEDAIKVLRQRTGLS